jgi:hypothetical protein
VIAIVKKGPLLGFSSFPTRDRPPYRGVGANVALNVGEESVSGVTAEPRRVSQEHPLMRIYIIGNDGITLCRKAPATVSDGEIAVASNEDLHAAPLTAKRLLALWNALLVSKSEGKLATVTR